ncbi:hypothetical protein B7Y94_03575 [Candidatus Saccharibacteria bacterium 32-49-12]|nr:MAG: hypothetical protein B7Y94_03575 [Candidatus Saccharibacteria bacterium 32-49-12]
MIILSEIEHPIQKSILDTLLHTKYARFSQMKPSGVETNLCTYHLKLLQKRGFVAKTNQGYTLDKNGLIYADRLALGSQKSHQPRVVTMHVVQNSDGDLLLYRRSRQPFAEQMALVGGTVHLEDQSILRAAKREADEKLGLKNHEMVHAGDCYVRTLDGGEVAMSVLAHVFYYTTDDVCVDDRLEWVRPHKLASYNLAPAVEQIVARTFFRDPYFFEEYSVELGELY